MKCKLLFSLLLIFSFVACEKEDEPCTTCGTGGTGGTSGISERDKAVNDYLTNYLGSEITDPGWTGDASSCNAGTVPQATHDKVLQRIKYFRRIVGLNDNITLNTAQFPMLQQTALLMKANNALEHNPPNHWNCWTQSAKDGAAISNLSLAHSSTAITRFILDEGPTNVDCGHRRLMLHSEKMEFSYGTTDKSMAVAVVGNAAGNTKIPPFIAYPPRFVPQPLLFPRWSFGIPNADFSVAEVKMKGPKGDIPVTIVSRTANFGDNTIVWEPSGITPNLSSDVQYTVTVSNVMKALQTEYVYMVTVVNP